MSTSFFFFISDRNNDKKVLESNQPSLKFQKVFFSLEVLVQPISLSPVFLLWYTGRQTE